MAELDPRTQRSDRRMKVALLMTSLATIVVLVVAALQENRFADWYRLRSRYAGLLEKMATDEDGRRAAEGFRVEIQQNYLPRLDVADRCVTCHAGLEDPRMADQAQPFATHPGHHVELHPPEKFGCTVCHQGQGRATETHDAHGHVEHWQRPMLAAEHVRARCSRCHLEPDLYGDDGLLSRADLGPNENALLLSHGRDLFNEQGCMGCHAIDGRGGRRGPDLSDVGDSVIHDFDFSTLGSITPRNVEGWLSRHFLDPASVSPGSVMPATVSAEEARALTAYMMSLGRSGPAEYSWAPAGRSPASSQADGSTLYLGFCSACHGTDGRGGRVDAINTPTLNLPSALAVAGNDFYRFIIEKGRSGTGMPRWGAGHGNLTRNEIDRIVTHLRNWEPEGPDPAEADSSAGDAESGEMIYEARCMGCHGWDGEGGIGNAIGSSDLLALVDDIFLARTIVAGRPGTAMPSHRDLEPGQLDDLLAFLRQWQLLPSRLPLGETEPGDQARGRVLYDSFCTKCHGSQGQGSPRGSQLNNVSLLRNASDALLAAIIMQGRSGTTMKPFAEFSAAGGAATDDSPPQDITDIVAWIRQWELPEAWRIHRPMVDNSAVAVSAGKAGWLRYCAPCHGENGEGKRGGEVEYAPAINNPEFLEAADDGFLLATIARGRTGTPMPAFGEGAGAGVWLEPGDILNLVSFIRSWQQP